jgi:hypothetical protein
MVEAEFFMRMYFRKAKEVRKDPRRGSCKLL